MYNEYMVSKKFEKAIREELIGANGLEVSRHRILQLSLKGDKHLYTTSLLTHDGFMAEVTFDLSQTESHQTGFSKTLNFIVPEIIITFDKGKISSVSTTECGEDFITSQFNKVQFVSLLKYGFSLAFSKLQEINSEVMLARSSWYGDEHRPLPDDGEAFYMPHKGGD